MSELPENWYEETTEVERARLRDAALIVRAMPEGDQHKIVADILNNMDRTEISEIVVVLASWCEALFPEGVVERMIEDAG